MSGRLKYSVEAEVSAEFAWRYRTDIANWNDPPATFTIEGPFAEGTCGTTLCPGMPPMGWRIADVRVGEWFLMEMPLDGAMLTFEWWFEEVGADRVKLTQEIGLSGEKASDYAAQVEAGFGGTLADGMKRIAGEMEAAAQTEKNASSEESVGH